MHNCKPIFLAFLATVGVCSAQDEVILFGGVEYESYTKWVQGTQYAKSTFLAHPADATKGVAIHWTVDEEKIYLAIAAKAQGWVGFGIAEAGSMRGADTIMFSAETNELEDGYVLDDLIKPLVDDCQSWALLNSTVDEDFIMFEASRALDTGDTQDRVFIDDKDDFLPPTRIIAAWGDSTGPSFHGSNFARGVTRFFAEEVDLSKKFASLMESEAEGEFVLGANDFSVPTNETTYHLLCLSTEDLVAQGVPMDQNLHLIGVEEVIDSRAVAHVHHFLVFGTMVPFDSSQSCSDDFEFGDLLYLWAPGTVPLLLPENVGIPFGGSSGYMALQIEIHYDNPAGVDSIVDSSGIRAYFTTQKRDFDMGVLSVGDPTVEATPRVLSEKGGLTQHAFECPSDCTNNYFQETVTVFGEALHMHQNGKSIVNEQVRDGAVVRQGLGQFYDFEAQGGLAVTQAPFELKPGDSFRTTCTFDADPGEEWGLGSADEMCIAFLYYYPRQTIPIEDDYGAVVAQFQPLCGFKVEEYLPGCGVDYTITPDFTNEDQINRDFGKASAVCVIGGRSEGIETSWVGAVFSASVTLLTTFSMIAIFL